MDEDLYLPNECWESILKFLSDGHGDDVNRYYFRPISVVSKQFLSITDRLRFSVTIYGPTRPFIHRLFKRFTNLTSLDLTCFDGDLDALLSQISCFRLNLTSLNLSNQYVIPTNGLQAFSKRITTLTSFICCNIDHIDNSDLTLIFDCFPLLEVLDLSNSNSFHIDIYITNVVINAMLMALPKLRKVNFSRSNSTINDLSLLHLCKNCEFLEEVIMLKSRFLTHHGVASAIRERTTLRSISVTCTSFDDSISTSSSYFIDSLVNLKGLTCLDLSFSLISDQLLSSIATGGLPLRSLVLQSCTGYSYDGIYSLIFKCRYIQHLDLQKAEFLTDHHVINLSLFLRYLVSINLSYCSNLTDSSLFSLVRNCPSLSEIKMENTTIRRESVGKSKSLVDFGVSHPQLKYLYLAFNSWLSDESIKMFASIFPNLQLLDLGSCYDVSEEGIFHVLRRGCKIRHLNLADCVRVNFKVPKLEVLDLSCTLVDDESVGVAHVPAK
ncbi:F-box/LRR-repeat protein [Trifolium repens]|nr:F-box/LRR-repeat protein [Trifolium repens]